MQPTYEAPGIALPIATTASLYRKITWRLIPFLCLCYLAAYLDRINIGLAKLQMSVDLQFSETVYGLGAGLFLSAMSRWKCRAICCSTASARGYGSAAS